MVYIEKIKLRSSSNNAEELHRFAAKIVVSKSWFNMEPYPHYTLVCPYRYDRAFDLIERIEKKKNLESSE